jgi:versiconal hemiacetal acetate esterase
LFGLSAGANLALCAALKLIDEGFGSFIKGIVAVAVVPVTIDPEFVPEELKGRYTSYEEHAEHTVNMKKGIKAFYGTYGIEDKSEEMTDSR